MPKIMKKRSRKIGLPPGSLVYVGDKKPEMTKVTLMDYNESGVQERGIEDIEECISFRDQVSVTWINIDGIDQMEVLQKIGDCFKIHLLVLEDVMNTDQRPKIEDFGDYIYIVLKMLSYDDRSEEVSTEQMSLVLSQKYIISFQERKGDVFDPIRERIRNSRGIIRKMGSDYLAYALIDSIVDNYFLILEKIGEKIEFLEDELVTNPKIETLQKIHELKRNMIFLRKSVWPLREVISKLEGGGSQLIKEPTFIYFRDVYDHTIQVIDAIETFRDMLSGMLDIYLSSISNRMNEVMKVLTIIATIFIPLTLVAGVYGMNFRYMPELETQLGYPLVLLSMLAVGILMLLYFKKRKWI